MNRLTFGLAALVAAGFALGCSSADTPSVNLPTGAGGAAGGGHPSSTTTGMGGESGTSTTNPTSTGTVNPTSTGTVNPTSTGTGGATSTGTGGATSTGTAGGAPGNFPAGNMTELLFVAGGSNGIGATFKPASTGDGGTWTSTDLGTQGSQTGTAPGAVSLTYIGASKAIATVVDANAVISSAPFASNAWMPFVSAGLAGTYPAVSSSDAGPAQLLFLDGGNSRQLDGATWNGSAWSASTTIPTGAGASMPGIFSAPAVLSYSGGTYAAYVNIDNVVVRQLTGTTWGAEQIIEHVDSDNIAPCLVPLTGGAAGDPDLLVVYGMSDDLVHWATHKSTGWTVGAPIAVADAPNDNNGSYTPTLASLPGGDAMLVYVSQATQLLYSFFDGSGWTKPALVVDPMGKALWNAGAPAIATGLGDVTAELVFLSDDGDNTKPILPFHTRLHGTWTAPAPIPVPTAAGPGVQSASVALASH